MSIKIKTKNMRQEDQLISKYGRDPGFRVPDGYFDRLNSGIMASLPPYPEAPKPVDLSLWQRIKPYAYLAAMFAGIWLMMGIFHHVSTTTGELSLDNPPASIASAMALGVEDAYPYIMTESDYELEKEVSAYYDSFDEFENDFGYELKPEFSSLNVSASNNTAAPKAEKPV